MRAAIARDGLGSGSRLPAIRDLARELGVHRDTVAPAYEALAADGVVESTVGPRHVRGGNAAGAPRARRRRSRPRSRRCVERLLEFERARPRFGQRARRGRDARAVPDPSLYPAEPFRRALNRALARGGPSSCSTAARRATPRCARRSPRACATRQLPVAADELVLCHGASQGIALALRLFCAPGDAVAVEEPTYHNVLGAALALGLRTAPVPMREDGVDLARLEQTLARPEVKAFYTIPTFHNPLGTTTDLAHRRALLAIARRAGKPVIEDAYEMDLRFAGAPRAAARRPRRERRSSCSCSRSRSRCSRARASARCRRAARCARRCSR